VATPTRGEKLMTFKPKLQSYRARIITIMLVEAFYGIVVLLAGRDYCHHGKHALILAAILALAAIIPESPGSKKLTAEKYPLGGKP
jgi:hypothetical protein